MPFFFEEIQMIEINNSKIDMGRIKTCIEEEVSRYEEMVSSGLKTNCEKMSEAPAAYDKFRLLDLKGEAFIHEAYRAILCREPDSEGSRHYLEKLMSGDLSREEILSRLRYSPEGRLIKVSAPGLLPCFLAHRFFQIPIIGWIGRVITGVLTLPKLIRLVRQMEHQSIGRPMEHQNIGRPTVMDQDRLLEGLYVEFENRFRGDRAVIKKRLSVYIPHVTATFELTACRQVLDLGCGRGEWLEILKEHGISGTGLDLNRIMVDICTQFKLDAVETNAISYLQNLEAESIGVVTGFHIVEHLSFNDMVSLLDESRRVLVSGGLVILETPNPENIQVGACDFYTDPTHRNPIPPRTLSFLVKARGFTDIRILRLNPTEKKAISDPVLNHVFTVGQDYAVIAQKK
jgi:SAM-dependent methyltransferase